MTSAPVLHLLSRTSLELPAGAVGHASTVLPTRDGGTLCAWFQGTREGADDVRITVHRGSPVGAERGRVMAPERDLPHWNPVLQRLEDGRVRLYFKVGRVIASWETWLTESLDDGRTWGPARLLVPDDPINRGPTRAKVLVLPSGRLLAPSSAEDGEWRAFVDISDDEGTTWRRSPEIRAQLEAREAPGERSEIPVSEQSFAGRGVIQPTLWLDGDGDVRMLLRSSEGRVFGSVSTDHGETWEPARATDLPNNNSGIDVVSIGPYGLLLVCNPVDVNWGPRTPLTVLWSGDDGGSWTKVIDLETGEGEYSYPAAVAADDRLLVSYTGDRRTIELREFRIAPRTG